MKINGVEFEFTGEVCEIKGRGINRFAQLKGKYTHSGVRTALLGQKINEKEIIGVEMFGVQSQIDTPIGLLFEGGVMLTYNEEFVRQIFRIAKSVEEAPGYSDSYYQGVIDTCELVLAEFMAIPESCL